MSATRKTDGLPDIRTLMEPASYLRKEKGNGNPRPETVESRSPSPQEEAAAIAIVINALFAGALTLMAEVHRHEEDLLARKLAFGASRSEEVHLNIDLNL